MALPPSDHDEAFLREVDEGVRRDEMEAKAKRYGPQVVGASIVLIAAAGGFLFWQDHQRKLAADDTAALSQVLDRAGAGDVATAATQLVPLTKSSSEGVSAEARLTQAALLLQKNDSKGASAIYQAVAADKDLAKPYRDLALVRATQIDYDSLKPDEVIARLAPLTKPGEPFFGSAGEMTGMAMIAKGQRAQAGQLFAQIAGDKTVPDTLRSRAVQVAGSLGVDASASMPDTAAAPAS
ncbi:tetratricopeptide repeat protein [Sphingomonas sp. ASV193]|uniref:tetratricopeptide repeat protein n=1 Tax=Sphingomonas sp. ASV193 TaxID=3144405 RepID=UPI0032E8C7AC